MSTTSTEEVTARLREHILSGHIPPGQKLQQIPLAEALGVSRTPLRTALTNLANEGLLQYESNRGFTVREFSLDDITAAYLTRAILEGEAAAIVARRGMPSAWIDRLDALLERGNHLLGERHLLPENVDPYRDMNVQFHDAIMEAAGNRWITTFVNQTHTIPFASNRLIIWLDHKLMVRSHDDHHRILRAIGARDANRAEANMREHIRFAGEYLRDCIESGTLPTGVGEAPVGLDAAALAE